MPETDGRGQLLPLSWLARALAWLKANPIWGLVGLLLLTVGYRGARIRHLEARQSRDQRKADLAALERSKLEARARESTAAARQTALDLDLEAAERKQAEGMGEAGDALERRKKLARKWPTGAVFLAISLWASVLPAFSQSGPCAPDADLTGLLSAVATVQAHLTGLDAEAVSDLLAVVQTYQNERRGLCTALDAARQKEEALRGSLALRDGLLEGCQADRGACWSESETRLRAPVVRPGRGPLGFTVGMGACLTPDGLVRACGAAVYGWRF